LALDENCPLVRTFCLLVQTWRLHWTRHRHLPNDACHRFRSAQAGSYRAVGLDPGESERGKSRTFGQKDFANDLAHFAMVSRGNCWLSVEGVPEHIALTGGDCFLLARRTSIVLRDSPRTRPQCSLMETIPTLHENGRGTSSAIRALLQIAKPDAIRIVETAVDPAY
jgi:hypothetical protein